MRIEGDRSESGLVTPSLRMQEKVLRHGRLAVIGHRFTLGYTTERDKRVKNRTVIKNTRIILMTPRDVEVVEHGKKGMIVHEPIEESDTHKITGVYVNSSPKLLTASSDLLLNLQRKTQSYGAKHLELTVASPDPAIEVLLHPGEELDVASLAGHMEALRTAPVATMPIYEGQ